MNCNELKVETIDDDLAITIPDDILDRLGWKEGDELEFTDNKDGTFTITKVKYETVELDVNDKSLFEWMQAAHKANLSLNQWINHVIKLCITEEENERTNN